MMKTPGGRRANDEDRSGPSPASYMAKKLDVPQSGKVGTTVNVTTRYGQIQRQYVKPTDPKTPAQMSIRSNLARVSARWRVLTEEQRAAWMLAAQEVHSRPRLGKSVRLTGCQLFIKINCARAAIGLDQFDDPPKVPEFGPNPVGELTITNTRGTIALKLGVPSTPAEHTVVYGAAPCSAGRYFVPAVQHPRPAARAGPRRERYYHPLRSPVWRAASRDARLYTHPAAHQWLGEPA